MNSQAGVWEIPTGIRARAILRGVRQTVVSCGVLAALSCCGVASFAQAAEAAPSAGESTSPTATTQPATTQPAATQPVAQPSEESAKADSGQPQPRAVKPAKPASGGWFSLGAVLAGVNGNEQAFRQHKWMDDHFSYGLEGLEYYIKDGNTLAEIQGHALVPYDYYVDFLLAKKKVGSIEAYFNQFPSYFNSGTTFYPFAPMVYKLDDDLVTVRQEAGVIGTWTPADGPRITLKADHWERNGNASTLWGRQVTDGALTYYRYPTYADIDQERNRLNLSVDRELRRFKWKAGMEVTDFYGENDITDKRFGSAGVVSQRRFYEFTPDFTELRPYVELSGDLIEKILRFEYKGEFRSITTDAGYEEHAVDAAGNPTNASRADNTVGNTHDGEVNETLHNIRLVYTPNAWSAVFGGFGFKYEDSEHNAIERLDKIPTTVPDGVADAVTEMDTADNRATWMGNLGAEMRPTKWLVGRAETRWEHGDLDRNWRGEGDAPFHWLTDEASNRVEYETSLAAKPTRELKIVGRWKQTIVENDYDDQINLIDDEPPAAVYPGDNSRRINQWSMLTQYKPCQYWWLTYKLAARTTEYFLEKELVEETATRQDVVNALSVSMMPVDRLTVTLSGSLHDMYLRTEAADAASVPIRRFNGDSVIWGLDADYELTEKIVLTGGLSQQLAESVFDFNSLDVYSGVAYKANDNWIADFRYTFTRYDEKGNSGISDYDANTFMIRLVGKF